MEGHVEPRAKLLNQMRLALRLRHLSRRAEQMYVGWTRHFILFHHMLKQEFPGLDNLERAKRPRRVPTVFTREEVAQLTGMNYLMASLLYGAGLRLMECLRLGQRCRLRVSSHHRTRRMQSTRSVVRQ